MPPDDPPPLPPSQHPPPPAPLNYGRPMQNPGSQWWTDEHAYGAALIFGLLGLTFLGGIIGVIWWIVSLFIS